MPLSKQRNRDRMRTTRTGKASVFVQPIGSGRLRHILSKEESLQVLTQIALNGNTKLTSPVEAIKEISRLEGRYPPTQHLVAQKVIIEIVHTDRRALLQPVVGLLEQPQDKDVVEGEVEELSVPQAPPIVPEKSNSSPSPGGKVESPPEIKIARLKRRYEG